MIKKLQIKFIMLSMSALLLVLIILIGGINIANYKNTINRIDDILSLLTENKGTFPMNKNHNWLPPHMSPEIPYESRFFSVLLDKDTQSVIHTETSRIITVDEAKAIKYANLVMNRSGNRGFVNTFRYVKHTETDHTRIIFLDCGRMLEFYHTFLIASTSISLLGFVIVLTLVVFFSNKIVRPISESYEKQKRFITDAGHEIKTPLTIINADTEVLEMEFGKNEWIEDIQKQSKRLTSLTNDLIYLARLEESETSMQMIEFPFSDVVSETAMSFHALAQTQNKTFTCRIQPGLTLRGDEKAVRQLTNILLDNALKYSPAGGIVTLDVEKHNRLLRLSVCNTTIHQIPKEKTELLFERFYRADDSRNSRTGGYGIGLSVAKAIVTAHNGKIQAWAPDEHSLQITASFRA